jgi:hypothetical protein
VTHLFGYLSRGPRRFDSDPRLQIQTAFGEGVTNSQTSSPSNVLTRKPAKSPKVLRHDLLKRNWLCVWCIQGARKAHRSALEIWSRSASGRVSLDVGMLLSRSHFILSPPRFEALPMQKEFPPRLDLRQLEKRSSSE